MAGGLLGALASPGRPARSVLTCGPLVPPHPQAGWPCGCSVKLVENSSPECPRALGCPRGATAALGLGASHPNTVLSTSFGPVLVNASFITSNGNRLERRRRSSWNRSWSQRRTVSVQQSLARGSSVTAVSRVTMGQNGELGPCWGGGSLEPAGQAVWGSSFVRGSRGVETTWVGTGLHPHGRPGRWVHPGGQGPGRPVTPGRRGCS